MAPPRVLVVDESLPRRLAPELRGRGREARHLAELGLRGRTDGDVLRRLAEAFPAWVLITADDRLPGDHAATVHATRATIATLEPNAPAGVETSTWRCDVVHRWARAMAERQRHATVARYSSRGGERWRARA
jgi:hypothetical protein